MKVTLHGLRKFIAEQPAFLPWIFLAIMSGYEQVYGDRAASFLLVLFYLFILVLSAAAILKWAAKFLISIIKGTKPYPLHQLILAILIPVLGIGASRYSQPLLWKYRIVTEPKFETCVKNAKPIGKIGESAWCEMRDRSGPVGSYNLLNYILYDSTDQITLPYAQRSMEWKKAVITYKYRSVFTSAYSVHRLSGHFYKIAVNPELGGDPVDSDLPEGKLKYCPNPDNPGVIPVCPGQEHVN